MFRRLSIHSKLTFALSAVALAAFVVAGVALLFFESLTLHQRARQTLESYAQLVSVGAEAAVRFEDAARAEQILNTLRANPQIVEAEIILGDGNTLAGYHGKPGSPPRFDATKPDGVYLSRDSAELIQGLPEGAHLHVLMSLDELKRQTMSVVLVLAAGLLGLLIAINLSLRATLKRTIVLPISTLAETVEQIRLRADYNQRVPTMGADEVARLGRSFNAMMGAIEGRDRELRELTRFQKTLLDSAAYGIVSATPDGLISSFNPAAERILGYTAAEVVGKLTPAIWHDPDEVAKRARRLSEELGELIPPGFEVFAARPRRNLPEECEWTYIRKDGTRVPVLLSVTILRGGNGQITGFLGLMNDLTEQKKNEAALREKTEELERYFANTLDLLCISDPDGRFRRLNPAWESTLGYSVAELAGRCLLDLVHPEDQPATAQAVSWLPEQSEVRNFTNRIRSKDGTYRWLDWRSFPSGNRIYSVASDVTDRVRAEAELRRLNADLDQRVRERTVHLEAAIRELDAFAYSVSHDLRAPLRSIDGFSRALEEDCAAHLGNEGQEYVRTIRGATKRMGHLIEAMLALARFSREPLRLAAVDLSAIASGLAKELQKQDPRRTVEFVVATNLTVEADANLMRAALENLLANSWKFTAKQPKPRIEFGRMIRDGKPTYFVRDNGCGFDMTYVGKLFRPFQRLHVVDDFPGTGIGLANVQRIIQRHGGQVTIEGAVGQGATVYFTLPNNGAAARFELGAIKDSTVVEPGDG